jgi:HTH-type transcriptional regulator, glycine betaine synthesis regulator
MDSVALSDFVESWGSMGALWGINRSMARIQALLLATKEPLGLDEVAERLGMSRGNASMCLKDLRHWGVVRRVNLTGERRDFYIAEDDIWSMLFRIASERKKREFDPALAALRKVLDSTGEDDQLVRERLGELGEILRATDRLLQRFLASEGTSRAMLKFLSAQIPYPPEK